MSFERRDQSRTRVTAAVLRDRLVEEFRTPTTAPGAPRIIAEPETGDITRLYVIWEEWSGLSLRERSELILDAYEEYAGQPAALKIALAMGASNEEARRMNLLPAA